MGGKPAGKRLNAARASCASAAERHDQYAVVASVQATCSNEPASLDGTPGSIQDFRSRFCLRLSQSRRPCSISPMRRGETRFASGTAGPRSNVHGPCSSFMAATIRWPSISVHWLIEGAESFSAIGKACRHQTSAGRDPSGGVGKSGTLTMPGVMIVCLAENSARISVANGSSQPGSQSAMNNGWTTFRRNVDWRLRMPRFAQPPVTSTCSNSCSMHLSNSALRVVQHHRRQKNTAIKKSAPRRWGRTLRRARLEQVEPLLVAALRAGCFKCPS
jgi:hypothetical protein